LSTNHIRLALIRFRIRSSAKIR